MAPDRDYLAEIASLKETLCAESTPMPFRTRALSSLKHFALPAFKIDYHACHEDEDEETAAKAIDAIAVAALEAIAAAFSSPSALLKHELAYYLGQSAHPVATATLRALLADLQEEPICRHEAAEALGAIGKTDNLDILRDFRDRKEEDVSVKETCEIAVDRIEWANSEQRKQEKLHQSNFTSVDPAPPLPESQHTVEELGKMLMDTSAPLFLRYRAMFALRDRASPPNLPTAVPAVHALAKGLADSSALFRHEIAFVFGQLQHPASIPALTASLSNLDEASMVRHEAAEALGSLGGEEGVEDTLKRFLHDKERIVRESVIVALDIADYEQSQQLEYATIPDAPQAAA
ncbi:deoxyhypusine hydroxylase [Xylariomycetidae sp. FL0641]|nr:deoxyhypusine hydroxylase [Xylariomycetidae sp. FL0641]